MKALGLFLAGLGLVLAMSSIGDTLLFRRAPTDNVLNLAKDLEKQGQLGRLRKIAESAPDAPLARVMAAGLEARRSGRPGADIAQVMETARVQERSTGRWLWVAAMLSLAGALVLLIGSAAARTVSVAAVTALGVGFLALAFQQANFTATELDRACDVLGPMLAHDPFDGAPYTILPALKTAEWMQLPEHSAVLSDDTGVGVDTLRTVYVLNFQTGPVFLEAERLDRLGIDQATCRREALKNLAATLPRETIDTALAGGSVTRFRLKDGYDAARLLAVPAQLKAGETLYAVVSDDDTLALVGPGKDAEQTLVQLVPLAMQWFAQAAPEKKLTPQVLSVTAAGIAVSY